jgi:hypothetical protein
VKCGDTIRFSHMGDSTCPIPDDEEELRSADVSAEFDDEEKAT